MTALIQTVELFKAFTLHLQGGVRLPVLERVNLTVAAGECVVLEGPGGCGKSTLLRCLYGNYRPQSGQILLRHLDRWIDICTARPQEMLEIRRHSLGFVGPVLRIPPRMPTIDVVAEPLVFSGAWPQEGRRRAAGLLVRLRIPERLWTVTPQTFSAGEQKRINIARGLITESPILLLDEPTAGLDPLSAGTVIDLISEAKGRGAAVVLVCQDPMVRERVVDRVFQMTARRDAA